MTRIAKCNATGQEPVTARNYISSRNTIVQESVQWVPWPKPARRRGRRVSDGGRPPVGGRIRQPDSDRTLFFGSLLPRPPFTTEERIRSGPPVGGKDRVDPFLFPNSPSAGKVQVQNFKFLFRVYTREFLSLQPSALHQDFPPRHLWAQHLPSPCARTSNVASPYPHSQVPTYPASVFASRILCDLIDKFLILNAYNLEFMYKFINDFIYEFRNSE